MSTLRGCGAAQAHPARSLFLSASRLLTDGAQGLGRPGLGTIAQVSSWALLLPTLGILTPLWHARGVAVALTVFSALSFAVLPVLLSRRREHRGARGPSALSVESSE